MRNTWIASNTPLLLTIKRFLIESEYKPEFSQFPSRNLQKLLNGAEAEISRLQSEVEALKLQLKEKKIE